MDPKAVQRRVDQQKGDEPREDKRTAKLSPAPALTKSVRTPRSLRRSRHALSSTIGFVGSAYQVSAAPSVAGSPASSREWRADHRPGTQRRSRVERSEWQDVVHVSALMLRVERRR